MEEILQIADIIQTIGLWLIGFYLFLKERESHDETRKILLSTLREVAGLERPLPARNYPDGQTVIDD